MKRGPLECKNEHKLLWILFSKVEKVFPEVVKKKSKNDQKLEILKIYLKYRVKY